MLLNKKQEEALALMSGPQRTTLLVGGSRSGKTFIICFGILVRALKAARSRHAIFRFRSNSVWSSIGLDTLPKVAHLAGVPITPHAADRYFTTPNGSEIWLSGLDDKDRVDKILGLEFSTIYENEASQIPFASHVTVETRLAQKIGGLRQRHFIDLNPSGASHWTNRLCIQKVDPVTRRVLTNPEDYAAMFINPKDNEANLTPEYLASMDRLPDRQRKRFFEGVYTADIDNALWTFESLDRSRIDVDDVEFGDIAAIARGDKRHPLIPPMQRIVVAIDPSGTSGESGRRSDAVGIVVAGRGHDGKGYVLSDRTCSLGPAGWANVAVTAYHEFRADGIVAEANFGGAMVEATIRAADKNIPYKAVTASRGKAQRAEPIAALYDEKIDRVRHVGRFPELEDQMCGFSTSGYMGERSPDRADACVFALTDLVSAPAFDGFLDYYREMAEQARADRKQIGADL